MSGRCEMSEDFARATGIRSNDSGFQRFQRSTPRYPPLAEAMMMGSQGVQPLRSAERQPPRSRAVVSSSRLCTWRRSSFDASHCRAHAPWKSLIPHNTTTMADTSVATANRFSKEASLIVPSASSPTSGLVDSFMYLQSRRHNRLGAVVCGTQNAPSPAGPRAQLPA